jgi:hypothetical protein
MGTRLGVEPQRFRYTAILEGGEKISKVCSLQRFVDALPPELGIKYATLAKNKCSFTHKGVRFERRRIVETVTKKEIVG